ncbi:hypothetical protein ACFL4O_01445 [bacterium]
MQPIQTTAEIRSKIIIPVNSRECVYKDIANKVKQLKLLGMPYHEIAEALNISKTTIIKSLKHASHKKEDKQNVYTMSL